MFTTKITLSALLFGCTVHGVLAQPIIYDGYGTDFFTQPRLFPNGQYCYHQTIPSNLLDPDMPTTAQYLAMFSDKFVEINGKVFTVKNAQNTGGFPHYPNQAWDEKLNGLYQVYDHHDNDNIINSCVRFSLRFIDDNIGQIVGSGSGFEPIEIIGVDQATNKIYGYYYNQPFFDRKPTLWGYALDGSLVAEPVEDGEGAGISGISRYDSHPSKDGSMFNLYGDFNNFNYARHDGMKCAGRPARIDDWSGTRAGSRGVYCPSEGNNKLWKYTWHSGGSTQEKLSWKAASKVARLGPKSNIYGVSTNGNLLQLWHEKGVAVHSAPLKNISPSFKVRAVGGLDDKYARGVFVSNDQDRVYNVYWDRGWNKTEIDIGYDVKKLGDQSLHFMNGDEGEPTLFFGNRDGMTYLLYGWSWPLLHMCADCRWADHYLFRLNFVGGNTRYEAEIFNSGTTTGVIFDGEP